MPTTISDTPEMAAAHITAPPAFFDRIDYISREIADQWLSQHMPHLNRTDVPPQLAPLARILLDWTTSYGRKCRDLSALLRQIATYPPDAPQRAQRLAGMVRSADILHNDVHTYRQVVNSMASALVQGRKQS